MGGIFAGNDYGLGVDAGFQGIHRGTGLAGSGARARGAVGMGATGAGLRGCHHMSLSKKKKAGSLPDEMSVRGGRAYGGFDILPD